MAVALDSNAIIGFLDAGDAFHGAADNRIRQLAHEGEALYASVVSYAEVLTGAKLGHHDEVVVRGFFSELLAEITPLELEAAERAAELRADRQGLKMPDALILASADIDPNVELIICADDIAEKVADLLSCVVEPLSSSHD